MKMGDLSDKYGEPEHTTETCAVKITVPKDQVFIPVYGNKELKNRKLVPLNKDKLIQEFRDYIQNKSFVKHIAMQVENEQWQITIASSDGEMLDCCTNLILEHITAWNLHWMAVEELAVRWAEEQTTTKAVYLDLPDLKAMDMMF
jgi:hypothetical protein